MAHPPVPAPAGLLAEAWVRTPDVAWGKIQQGVSGAVALLPPSVGELVCAIVGLDPIVGSTIDGKATTYIVLGTATGSPSASSLAWVVALPLTDPARATSLLLEGGDAAPARYTARAVADMQVLSSAQHPPHMTTALAVEARAWLVVASSEDDLARLGPYAVRTLPTRPAPPGPDAVVADVPQSALAGPLTGLVAARWAETRAWLAARDEEQRAKHGGRAPDFGDPKVILDALDGAVKRRIALLSLARGARVVIDAGDDAIHAELTINPGTDDESTSELAAMVTGDTRPLAQAPADTLVGLLARDDPKTREKDTAKLRGTLDQVLGARVHEDDTNAVHAAVTDWAQARGGWWTAGIAWGESDASRGIWLRTPLAATEDAANRAVRELVDLSHRTFLQDLLASSLHFKPAVVTRVDAPPVGKVSLATFAPVGHAAGATPVALAWGVSKADPAAAELLVTGAEAPAPLLSSLAAPGHRLGDDARSARALAALGDGVTFALFAQPLRAGASGPAAESAPVTFAWGRKDAGLWGHVELADRVVRELVRLQAGL